MINTHKSQWKVRGPYVGCLSLTPPFSTKVEGVKGSSQHFVFHKTSNSDLVFDLSFTHSTKRHHPYRHGLVQIQVQRQGGKV